MSASNRPSHGPRPSAGAAPEPRPPERVRDVVLVGRSGAGKTSLAEALLVAAGALPRAGRVEDGTTASDSSPLEQRQQRSVFLSLLPLEHEGVKVNLLDTPGHVDFVGELRAGLRAADAALFVVSAVDGVDERTRQLWRECAQVGLPRAVVVTQLDRARADAAAAAASAQQAFGDGVQPLHLLHGDGLLDLLRLEVAAADGSTRPAGAAEETGAAAERGALLEAVIAESEDEGLLDRYLGGEPLDLDVLLADLETAVARGSFHPVLTVCATTGLGLRQLLDLLVRMLPSPLERPAPEVTRPDGTPAPLPEGALLAEVVRTSTDPFLGRVSLVRVFSGELRPELPVHVSGHGATRPEHDADERVGPLSSPLGAALRPVAWCGPGDLCAVGKLRTAQPGDTLSSPDLPLLVRPWDLPEPMLPVALEPTSRTDEDRLDEALVRLAAEDPSFRVVRDVDTRQLVLWCQGEAHADVLVERLGVPVERVEVRVALRETLASAVTATGRLVKQSGGHGQYAVVHVEVAPLPTGSGIVFESRVVGGSVPTQYVASVEKGVRQQAERGVHEGRPLVDLSVVLVDGKAHAVDSSDAAFQAAGALALREAAAAAGVVVLEPVSEVEVRVPADCTGAVVSDLAGRRARVTGTEPDGEEAVVRAEVPDAELVRYASALRALAHGAGSCARRPLRHEPAPHALSAAGG